MSDLFGSVADPDGIERWASVSGCGLYRWSLGRNWAPPGALPTALFVMLNPSTADGDVDDPTIRRCIGFARSWGCGGVLVANLFPWRARKPRDLVAAREAGSDVVQRRTRDLHLRHLMTLAQGPHVAAWGAHAMAAGEAPTLPGDRWMCLGTTSSGAPRHPLYLRGDTELAAWECGVADVS